MHAPPADRTASLAQALNVSAGAFIVTLYGDVVAPRGGELWMGNIIEVCEGVGIGESRVRTAVSRLVTGGQLVGVKEGRRSYYRLSPSAEREFQRAARLIYAPPRAEPLRGWHMVILPVGEDRDPLLARLAALRFGLALPHLAIRPDRGEPLPDLGAPHFRATTEDDLTALAAQAWDLPALHDEMTRFLSAFDGLGADGPEALGLRLLLVHAFRRIALRDPALPLGILPEGWPAPDARALFARLYLALSPAADAAVAAGFKDRNGPLAVDQARMARRIADLAEA
ncbi:PaaX family transcriptional regulator C-terminal domain-containing protein [Pseudooceanicola onchidii]|uniref:PaaX family transcriptional regulator n=1 Tax=Pseudooceanicola onchidii TaxID=2562279 RepID=UPI0010AA07F0|nr:PaaX family transcriptional regulator C-terminal domain-containing protein [Pseudooceanicola onchidii]